MLINITLFDVIHTKSGHFSTDPEVCRRHFGTIVSKSEVSGITGQALLILPNKVTCLLVRLTSFGSMTFWGVCGTLHCSALSFTFFLYMFSSRFRKWH